MHRGKLQSTLQLLNSTVNMLKEPKPLSGGLQNETLVQAMLTGNSNCLMSKKRWLEGG